MTAEEKVKAKWPDAAVHWLPISVFYGVVSEAYNKGFLGTGESESDAWADAAKRLEEN